MTDRTARRARPLKRRLLKAARHVVGERGSFETATRSVRNAARLAVGKPITRPNLFAVRRGDRPRFGVYAFGGCDLNTVVAAGPALARDYDGPVCVGSFANAPMSHTQVVLQTLDPPRADTIAEVSQRLSLPDGYFDPVLFTPDFTVPDQVGVGSFPKRVVVLSPSSDVSRTLYEHREHGYVVDPGGWWLTTSMEAVLQDLSTAKWFASTFRKVGQISVEGSMGNFERIITEVRKRTGAHVVMMNVLTVDPGKAALDYQRSSSPNSVRRRRFDLALGEMCDSLDVPIVDVDRIAKRQGISGQADYVHYTPDQRQSIARELHALLMAEDVFAMAQAGR